MASNRRVSVTLDGPDQQAIEAFVDATRPEHATLESWATQRGLSLRDDSDAAVVRTLARAGAEALREKALEQGYELLADSYKESRHERQAMRDRAAKRAESRLAE